MSEKIDDDCISDNDDDEFDPESLKYQRALSKSQKKKRPNKNKKNKTVYLTKSQSRSPKILNEVHF